MRRLAALLVLATVGVTAGCRDDAVVVTFRPEVGATYRYEVRVHSETEVSLGGSAPERREDDVVLTARHTVLRAQDGAVRVRVELEEPDGGTRRFVVVFDRAAQLEEVESIEGVPQEVLGNLLSEIFPAAAGAPPDRALRPGDQWRIDDAVRLPGIGASTRLTGTGRLVELGVVEGEDVARLRSVARLPLVSTTPSERGLIRLDGVQETEYSATHDLDDGAVRSASSSTSGRFTMVVLPPSPAGAEPVTGSLEVRVRSETRRLD